MKHTVSGHALAIETVTVNGCTGLIELQVYEGGNGAYFAIDGSWLEQVPEDNKACYIPDPYNEGYSIRLLDTENDIKEERATLVSGDSDEELIEKVYRKLRHDVEECRDFTVLAELLEFVPEHILKGVIED